MQNHSPANIRRAEGSSPLSSLVSCDVKESELSIVKNTNKILIGGTSCNISSSELSYRSVGAGLLQAMIRRHSPTRKSRRNERPYGDTRSTRFLNAVDKKFDGQDSEESDSSPICGRGGVAASVQGRADSQTVHRQPSDAISNSTLYSKKRKRVEDEKRDVKLYHNEGKRRNIAPRVLYEAERQAVEILQYKPWLKAGQRFPDPRTRSPSGSFVHSSSPSSQMSQIAADMMSVKDRKRFFIYTPTEEMKKAMQAHVSKIHRIFSPTRKIGDCMLHPNPGGLLKSGNYNQVISCRYKWRDTEGIHAISVNFGLVALIVNSHLTAAQKEGYIGHAWHLSHLCGNWICCNWRHHTVEPGPVNIGRNACFISPEQCTHKPTCMKDKKQLLSLPSTPAGPSSRLIAVGAEADLTMRIQDGQEDDEEPE
ncbi:MAG: hypothetical protein Q9191_004289 [Dirinaria sp. TL-2023a]